MTELYFMPEGSLEFGSGMHWHFAQVGSAEASHRLSFNPELRKFEVSRLKKCIIPAGLKPHYRNIGREASVEELVALLPPKELALAIASSLTRKS